MKRWVFYSLLLVGLEGLNIPIFIAKTFGHVNFDQILFFLQVDNGIQGTDSGIVIDAITYFLAQPLLVLMIVATIDFLIKRFGNSTIILQSRVIKIIPLVIVTIFAALTCIRCFLWMGGSESFFQDNLAEDKFKEIYTPPTLAAPNEPKRNLILLYVESLETIYSDSARFGQDLNEPLTRVFTTPPRSIIQARGTEWSMAGMVSSQCGIPLAPFIHNNWERRTAPILANAKCLGDFLAQAGYQQFFFVGPDLKFSGMDKFYLAHGYNDAYGKDELKAMGMDPSLLTGWGGGPNDDALLEVALSKIKSLSQEKKLFNVTIITTDNHAPDGVLSPRCKADSSLAVNFAKAVKCTNQAIEKFVNDLNKEGIFKNTNLVIMGDHLFMSSEKHSDVLPQKSKRKVYFNFLLASGTSCIPTRPTLTHFDVAPTLLSLTIGAKTSKMGVGRNLCFQADHGYEDMVELLTTEDISSKSALYRSLW